MISRPESGWRESRSMWEEAYAWIRERILRGDFPPGAPLKRRELTSQLRMSLLPVSEALRRLELDGLVETQRRAGTRVRIPTIEDVEDHVVVRTAIESESGRLFCERATAEARSDLVARAEHLDYLRAGSNDVASDRDLAYAVHSYHVEFHLRIASGGRCRGLLQLMEQNQVLTLHWLYDLASGNSAPLDLHAPLAEVLAGNDPDQAAVAIREHVQAGSRDLLERFRSIYCADPAADAGKEPERPEKARRWRAGSRRAVAEAPPPRRGLLP
jgi:GntR family transcriptional regulator, rspAB operon transcriptional repressor